MTQQQELDQIKSQIQKHLITSGNYDIINKQLKLKLYETGWFDKITEIANLELQSQLDEGKQMSFEDLYSFIKSKADDLVPEEVKKEIEERIQQYLDSIIE